MNNIIPFLDGLFNEIKSAGIDVSTLKMDHIAFSTSSSGEYDALLPKYLEQGTMVKEAIISGRRVAIIKLNKPVKYLNYETDVIELIEPIKGENAISGWEHVEFLVHDYGEMLRAYPDLNWNTAHMARKNFSRIKLTLPSGREVKFLDTPVLVSAKADD